MDTTNDPQLGHEIWVRDDGWPRSQRKSAYTEDLLHAHDPAVRSNDWYWRQSARAHRGKGTQKRAT